MQRVRTYSPKQDPFYRPGGDDRLTLFLTREAGTDQWDCTVYLGRYREVVELWSRQPSGVLTSKYYGLKIADKVVKWTRVRIPAGTGGTGLIRAAVNALRESLATEDATERPESDPLW